MNDIIEECLAIYWELGEYAIDDRRRMQAVIKAIADNIRAWAPPEEQARICHMAINEVADRLVRDRGTTTSQEDYK
jgi:hypothetical protein